MISPRSHSCLRRPLLNSEEAIFSVIPVKRDLCVTSAAVPLNVILSAAKNPKGFIPRQRSFAGKGFGFFTSLLSVQNDSETRIFGEDTRVMQRSLKTGI